MSKKSFVNSPFRCNQLQKGMLCQKEESNNQEKDITHRRKSSTERPVSIVTPIYVKLDLVTKYI